MRISRNLRLLIPACALGLVGTGATRTSATAQAVPERPAAASRPVDYAGDVKPLLAARCYACHGPKKQKAGLRLDEKAAALRGGSEGVQAIEPGHGAESDLVRRIASTDPDVRMPPEGEPLKHDQVSTLRAWIDQGAKWPDDPPGASGNGRSHWAFRPPVRPAVPPVRAADWARNPIDRFILARLEAEGLSPSPEADPVTLLRRLSLDLVGLPPSVEEVDAFLADTSGHAYERAVDRLLASPHYGERWGRHWLDAARYADSDGYEKDKSRFVWFYRDWVVNALNRDLPYDRFVIEQIAGDQLPGASQDSGRRHRLPAELDDQRGRGHRPRAVPDGGHVRPHGRHRQGHPRPHHPVRPVPQPQVRPDHPGRVLPALRLPEQRPRGPARRLHARAVADGRRALATRSARSRPGCGTPPPTGGTGCRGGRSRSRTASRAGSSLAPTQVSEADTRFIPQEDGSVLAQGYAPAKFTYDFEATSDLPEIRAFRLELLTDPNLPANGPGRSFKGTCTLTEFQVEAADAREPGEEAARQADRARRPTTPTTTATWSPTSTTGRAASGSPAGSRSPSTARTTRPGASTPAPAAATPTARRSSSPRSRSLSPPGTVLTFHLVSQHGGWNNNDHQQANLGRFRLERDGGQGRGRRPAPEAGARDPGRPGRPAVARPGGRRLRPLADDRPRVPGGERTDRGALSGDGPRGRRH